MVNSKKNKLSSKGLEILGAAEALKKSREQYPTYDELLKRHSDYFHVKEKISFLGI